MNAKRCKELRSNLRQQGIDPRDVNYGEARLRAYQRPMTRKLVSSCGRAVYQAAKKAGAV